MLYRDHRGSLAESMETVVELKDRAALDAHIAALLKPWGKVVTQDQIHSTWYCLDPRINWDTWMITVDGYGVVGFTNGDPQRAFGRAARHA
jgi:hypothetical protein